MDCMSFADVLRSSGTPVTFTEAELAQRLRLAELDGATDEQAEHTLAADATAGRRSRDQTRRRADVEAELAQLLELLELGGVSDEDAAQKVAEDNDLAQLLARELTLGESLVARSAIVEIPKSVEDPDDWITFPLESGQLTFIAGEERKKCLVIYKVGADSKAIQ